MKQFLAAALSAVVIAAGCSSAGPEAGTLFPPTTATAAPAVTTVPTVVTTTTVPVVAETTLADHSLDYSPASDAFAFENFGGGTAPADLTVNMARRLYGDEQVCSDVTDNRCTPYPVILQLISQANRSMQGGLCEGLTVLSLRLANDPITLASFQNVDEVSALVKEDPALLSELAYWYVTQFAVEVQQEASAYLEMHPTQLAEILLRDFAAAEAGESSTGYTVGIYSEQGGHAITPYRVEETANGYRIYIYDSNWPTSERWIDVDADGWSYALAATNPTEEASAWGGGAGTMELTPMRSRSGPFSCGFCPSDTQAKSGTLLTVASTGDKQMALKIETESGDRLGYYDGGFVNEIEGATYRYLISGPTTADPVLVFLPPGVETFSADVEEIEVPTLEEPEQEEPTQKFSLLLLNEEKSVQIEAAIVEEEPVAEEEEEREVSLIDFSEESVSIADVEDATVAIAIDSLAIEVELDEGQTVQVILPPDPPAPQPVTPDAPVVEEAPPQMLDLSIQDDQGGTLAEVAVDISLYRVDLPPEPEPDPQAPEVTIPPPPPPAPVVITIVYDMDTGVIEQEEEVVEAWVASDAEYYQAIVDDNLEEVLGESYVEELEAREEWVDEDEAEARIFLSAVLEEVSDDYWEAEHWEEISYDDEWFEEEAAEEEVLWEEVEDPEVWFEEEAWEPLEETSPPEPEPEPVWETEPEQEEELDVQEEEDAPPPEDEGGEDDPVPFGEDDDNDGSEGAETPPDGDGTEDGVEIEEVPEEEEGPVDDEPEAEPEEEEPDEGSETALEEDGEEELPDSSTDNPEEEGSLDDPEWEDEEDPSDEPEDTDGFDEEPLPDPDLPPEEEVDEEQVVEAEVPPTTTVAPEPEPEPVPEPEPGWDQYDGCRGTSACEDAPGGYDSWQDYDQANDPGYYEDWGEVPEGFINWTGFTEAVESGEVSAEVAEGELPDFVLEEEIVVVYVAPVYVPTYTTTNAAVALQETISTSTSTAQTGTATAATESGILTHNSNDGHWHLDTTTATTVTTTHVDTTTVVARTGIDFVSCIFIDGTQSGCSTQRTWNDNETTATTGDPYTSASTTTATVGTEEGCAEGGWRGMGDWCIVQSSSRNDHDMIQFSLDEITSVRIDAETNLTRAQFNTSNEAADPYIYLNNDNDSDEGDHSADESEITVGTLIELDDDGGNDCGNTCVNPPSSAVDVDETPTITYCNTGGACSNGVPVIDNVSDQWDSRIVRTNMPVGDYVVRASVYNGANAGWYRLTIEEDE